MSTTHPSLPSFAKTIGCLLLGIVAGVLVWRFVPPLYSLWGAVQSGGITDDAQIEAFFAQRRVIAFLLVAALLAWLAVMVWARRASRFATVAFGGVFSVLTMIWHPEMCPFQFLMEGRPAQTALGDGFSREGFLAVKPGMTKDQVASLVGRGLWSRSAPEPFVAVGWSPDGGPDYRARWYLTGPGTEDHWRYGVEFDTSGLVLHKWLEFWWD